MTAPPRRALQGVTGHQLEREIKREVAQIKEDHRRLPNLPSKRCRVCQHPESRTRVNTLLSYGVSLAEILEMVEEINDKRAKNNKITMEVLKSHRQNHFNRQAPTQAAYRRILERRKAQIAEEYGDDVEHMLTGLGFLDIVAYKGFQNAIDESTVIPYADGLQAQLKIEALVRDGQFEEQVAQMRRDVSLLEQAVTDVVPEQYRAAIVERLDELTGKSAKRFSDDSYIIEAEVVESDDFFDSEDDSEQGFRPRAESDEGDSIED